MSYYEYILGCAVVSDMCYFIHCSYVIINIYSFNNTLILSVWSLISAGICRAPHMTTSPSHSFSGECPLLCSTSMLPLYSVSNCCQKKLSSNIEDFQFKCLLNKSSLAHKARLLSVSAPHSSSWLSMIPTPGQFLHLDPEECHIAVKWWLGMDTSAEFQRSLCHDHSLDPLGHHATTCKRERCCHKTQQHQRYTG